MDLLEHVALDSRRKCALAADPQSMFVKEGAALPREIITWLQSLGLSQAVKHPRHDLANGFLIAQLCANYWPQHVQLHSFVNQLSLENKKSNWSMLRKVFHKRGVAAAVLGIRVKARRDEEVNAGGHKEEEAAVEAIMQGKEGCAEALLRRLYVLLTGRSLPVTSAGSIATSPKAGNAATMAFDDAVGSGRDARSGSGMEPLGAGASAPHLTPMEGTQLHDLSRAVATPTAGPLKVGGDFVTECDRLQPMFTVSPVEAIQYSAVGLIEEVVKRASVQCRWTLGGDCRLRNKAESAVGQGALPYVTYFLAAQSVRCDDDDGVHASISGADSSILAVQQSASLVWGTLLSHVTILADLAQRDVDALHQLADLFLPHLFSLPAAAAGSGGDSEARAREGEGRDRRTPCAGFASRIYALLAAIFVQLADLDPFFASTAFTESILHFPGMGKHLCTMDATGARGVASLIMAVVPLNRPTARLVLPDLLSKTYNVISAAAVAADSTSVRCSNTTTRLVFISLLCAVLSSVSPAIGIGSGSDGRSLSGSAAAIRCTKRTGRLATLRAVGQRSMSHILSERRDHDDEDGYNAAMYRIGRYHALCALTSESPTLRLAGAALAVRLVPYLRERGGSYDADDFWPLLFAPHCPAAMRVYQARWLGAVLQHHGTLQAAEQGAARARSPQAAVNKDGPTEAPSQQQGWECGKLGVVDGCLCPAAPVTALAEKLRLCWDTLLGCLTAANGSGCSLQVRAAVAFELGSALGKPWAARAELPINGNGQGAAAASPPGFGLQSCVADAVLDFLSRDVSTDVCEALLQPAEGEKGGVAPAPLLPLPPFGEAAAQAGMLSPATVLLLSEAVLRRYRPHSIGGAGGGSGTLLKSSSASSAAKMQPADGSGARHRILWLHRITVATREGVGMSLLPWNWDLDGGFYNSEAAETSENKSLAARWRAVLQCSGRDLIGAMAAAEAHIQAQHSGTAAPHKTKAMAKVEKKKQQLFDLAAMAQRVALCWYLDLSPFLTPSAAAETAACDRSVGGADASVSREAVHCAVHWLQSNFCA